MALNSEMAASWCLELAENLSSFRKKGRLKPEMKLSFISKQYASLFTLVKVNRGDTIMKGFPFRTIPEDDGQETTEE